MNLVHVLGSPQNPWLVFWQDLAPVAVWEPGRPSGVLGVGGKARAESDHWFLLLLALGARCCLADQADVGAEGVRPRGSQPDVLHVQGHQEGRGGCGGHDKGAGGEGRSATHEARLWTRPWLNAGVILAHFTLG